MRLRRWIIPMMTMLLLAGCSAIRLTYNQVPTLAYYWIDAYADFNETQRPKVKQALADWTTWHRATQLPEYAQALGQMRSLLANKITPEQVCAIESQWQDRIERVADQALVPAAEVVQGLSPRQIDHIERRLAKKHEDWLADFAQATPTDRHKARLARWVDRAESLYGGLDEAQQQALSAALLATPYSAEQEAAERMARHQDLLRHLRQWTTDHSDVHTIATGLRRLGNDLRQSPRLPYREQALRSTLAQCTVVAQLHNGTKASQRQHAAGKLKGWEDDLSALAASAR
jgi:hypothetical protein